MMLVVMIEIVMLIMRKHKKGGQCFFNVESLKPIVVIVIEKIVRQKKVSTKRWGKGSSLDRSYYEPFVLLLIVTMIMRIKHKKRWS